MYCSTAVDLIKTLPSGWAHISLYYETVRNGVAYCPLRDHNSCFTPESKWSTDIDEEVSSNCDVFTIADGSDSVATASGGDRHGNMFVPWKHIGRGHRLTARLPGTFSACIFEDQTAFHLL